jgi:hypothetical protein
MDFFNKVGDFVGKGFDSLKSQLNKAQENVFTSPQQNTTNLPKGVHILGAIENENDKETNNNNNDDQTQYNNKFSNFFGINPNTISNDINNKKYNNNLNQLNQNNSNEQPKSSSSMLDYFKKNSNMKNINVNNNNYNIKNSEPDKEFLSGFELINGEKSINWSKCMLKLERGAYPCKVAKDTIAYEAYKETEVSERHRHRYEVNNEYKDFLIDSGVVISGTSPDDFLVEMIELKDHPWFLGCQFHPEFKSRPNDTHPIFKSFIKAAKDKKENKF